MKQSTLNREKGIPIEITIYSDDNFTQVLKSEHICGDIVEEYQKTFCFLETEENRKYYPQVPLDAMKEALLNLLVHRDYSQPFPSQITIFGGNVDFLSYGGLVQGVELEDIRNGISACRNPALYEEMVKSGLNCSPGQGFRVIYAAYSGSDSKPEIHIKKNSFKLHLPPLRDATFLHVDTSMFSIKDPGPDIQKKREQKILVVCEENGSIRRSDVQNLFDISQPMAGIVLRRMVESGVLRREGNGRNTVYLVQSASVPGAASANE